MEKRYIGVCQIINTSLSGMLFYDIPELGCSSNIFIIIIYIKLQINNVLCGVGLELHHCLCPGMS